MPYATNDPFLTFMTSWFHDPASNTYVSGSDPVNAAEKLPSNPLGKDVYNDYLAGLHDQQAHDEASIYHSGMTMDEVAQLNRERIAGKKSVAEEANRRLTQTDMGQSQIDALNASTPSLFAQVSKQTITGVIVIVVAIILLAIAAGSLVLPQAGNIKTLADIVKK